MDEEWALIAPLLPPEPGRGFGTAASPARNVRHRRRLIYTGTVCAALAGGGTRLRVADNAFMRLVAVVLIGLVVNAAISGIISGVSGRYQARFSPLAVYVLLALFARRIQEMHRIGFKGR